MNNFFTSIKNFFVSLFKTPILPKPKKLVIIMSGGAMNCAYGAGFLEGLSQMKLPKKFTIIAASGNAGNATYFASGQGSIGYKVWIDYLSGDKLINFRRRKILDIDYLVDYLFKKEFPLDIKTLQKSNVEVLVPATCYETGEVAYFSNKENWDWFEVLRAAKALPVVYGKRVLLGSYHYFDTPHSSSWSSHLEKAEDIGATHTIIINLNRLYANRFAAIVGEFVVKNYMFAENSHYQPHPNPKKADYEINTQNNVFIKPLELANNLETDKLAIKKLWDAGYKEAMNNHHLKEVLESIV